MDNRLVGSVSYVCVGQKIARGESRGARLRPHNILVYLQRAHTCAIIEIVGSIGRATIVAAAAAAAAACVHMLIVYYVCTFVHARRFERVSRRTPSTKTGGGGGSTF